jgi:predicted nucleic acid-binding protein
MASAVLGLVLDSSVLVAAERANRTTRDAIEHVRTAAGDVPIIICALTVAELATESIGRIRRNAANSVASFSTN